MIKKCALLVLVAMNIISCNSQDTLTYDDLKNEMASKRNMLKDAYDSANTDGKEAIIHEAEDFLFSKITSDFFNAWENTPWDFNGQSRVPKEGKIACGYFVTGVLFDAGLNIPRVRWAQLPSETFIRKLSNDVKRFQNTPIEEIKEYINKKGDGLYLVGLDMHVGYIYKKGDKIKFVHSSYYHPTVGVMSEDLETVNPLNDSKYKVIGKLLDHEQIVQWINSEKIE